MITDWGDASGLRAPSAELLTTIFNAGFITAVGPDAQVDFAAAMSRAASWAAARAGELITNADANTRQGIAALVARTMDDPTATMDDLRTAIQTDFTNMSEYRAEMIARTETAEAAGRGDVAAFRETDTNYVEIDDGEDFDQACADANGQVWSVDYYEDNISEHPNAVFGGSTFAPYGALVESRRAAYHGPAIRVRTTDGHETTIGPNHPMLTSRGMTMAQALRKGDQLAYDRRSDPLRTVGGGEEDSQQVPAVQDVFEALRAVSPHARVPCSRDDLHGDGAFCEGEVEVVWPARELLKVGDAPDVEHVRELDLPGTDVGLLPEIGEGSALAYHRRVVAAASGGVGSVGGSGHFVLLTVASVEKLHYFGAAFDHTTETSLYCSDGFVVSNCGRVGSAITDDEARDRGVDQGDPPEDEPSEDENGSEP